jgi:putative ABC transport system permease protein
LDEFSATFKDQLALPALPLEQREVTAILVRTSSNLVSSYLQNEINEGVQAQVVLPVLEIYTLFEVFVKPVQLVLLVLTAMICVVSGVSILVSIYNSMAGRRHEIAVMRALGASRNAVMSIVLIESIILSVGGGICGWVLGHTLNFLASPVIERRTGVSIGFLDFAPKVNLYELLGGMRDIAWLSVSSEVLLIPSLLILAVVVGFLPALAAYRTDVAASLGK